MTYQTASTKVLVIINNVNDNAPSFGEKEYQEVWIEENVSNINLLKLNAIDLDGDSITYVFII